MSITPLSAARIVGELGLAGGTITGGTYAAQYANKVVVVERENKRLKSEKEGIKNHSTNTSSAVYNVGTSHYLFNKWLMQNHPDVVQEFKSEISSYTDCLSFYLMDSSNKGCIETNVGLKDKMLAKGITYS